MKMALNYSSNNSFQDFPIDWNAWRTTSVPIGTIYNPIITTSGTIPPEWTITTSGTISPGWLDNAIQPVILNPFGEIEIQQQMAFEAERFGLYNQKKFGKEKKVFPRKPLRMIRIQEDAKKS